MSDSRLIFTTTSGAALDEVLTALNAASVFVLVDSNVERLVLPRLLSQCKSLDNASIITIEAGETNKNLNTLAYVWTRLSDLGATRSSVLVNVGGGVVTDLGGFAAATFKRSIRFVNVPTTLLAAVDASVGGKTGIDFNDLKNEIGVFCDACSVIISSCFFDTLPREELLSGYAEILKHGLLSSQCAFDSLLAVQIDNISADRMLRLVEDSVAVKAAIVSQDYAETGLRRALNLGHTAGHAFETMALNSGTPMPHGYAVAHGLVVALILSHFKYQFPSKVLYRLAGFVRDMYGVLPVTCDNYPAIIKLMGHDKKNERREHINFTLLHNVGATDVLASVEQKATVSQEDITAALDIYRDLMGV